METITYFPRPTKVQSTLERAVDLYEIFKISNASAPKQIELYLSLEASWERVSRECDPYLRTASTDRDRSRLVNDQSLIFLYLSQSLLRTFINDFGQIVAVN